MEKVIITTSYTDNGYCGACDILPGWVVAYTGDFDGYKKEVVDSINFYIDCAKKEGDEYPSFLDSEYEIVYKFDVRSLLLFYQGIFSFSALETITGINQKQLAHYAAGRSKPRKLQADKIEKGLHNLARNLMEVSV